jgi:hypothetical protein
LEPRQWLAQIPLQLLLARFQLGHLRSVRALRGIDSKVSLNKGLWGLVERLANGQPLESPEMAMLN